MLTAMGIAMNRIRITIVGISGTLGVGVILLVVLFFMKCCEACLVYVLDE